MRYLGSLCYLSKNSQVYMETYMYCIYGDIAWKKLIRVILCPNVAQDSSSGASVVEFFFSRKPEIVHSSQKVRYTWLVSSAKFISLRLMTFR